MRKTTWNMIKTTLGKVSSGQYLPTSLKYHITLWINSSWTDCRCKHGFIYFELGNPGKTIMSSTLIITYRQAYAEIQGVNQKIFQYCANKLITNLCNKGIFRDRSIEHWSWSCTLLLNKYNTEALSWCNI